MRSVALSPMTHRLAGVVGLLFGLVGAVMVVAPDWAAANFPWRVSPFAARTMGAWYLGATAYAWEIQRGRTWGRVYPAFVFLWSFALLEAMMPVLHAGVVRLNTVMALPYLGSLAVGAVAAVVGIVDLARTRPSASAEGETPPLLVRLMVVAFAVLVFWIAWPLLLGQARGGTIWPGELTLLTARSFGAFYLALVIADSSLLLARHVAPVLAYMRAGLVLIVTITTVGVLHLGEFDFVQKPGGLVYFGIYILAGVGAAGILLWARRSRRGAAYSSTYQAG